VHYNAPDWISSSVDALLQSDTPVEVWVIDNGPAGALPALDQRVHVKRMSKNVGYAGAANVALRQWLTGTAPFCIIGSHDLHVDADCVSKLLEAAVGAPTFGILAPAIPTNVRGPTLGTAGDIESTLLRRHCIAGIGLFDSIFHSYCEDNELCARAIRHGWQVGTVTTAHARGLGTRHGRRRALNKQKNRLLLAWRIAGAKGVAIEYGRCVRLLAYALVRKRTELAGAVAALTVGTVRLARGIVTRPARS
jgi:GT2 family glycosyltransferase